MRTKPPRFARLPLQGKLLLLGMLVVSFLILAWGIHAAFKANTPGIDFYVYWQASRAFFLEGIDPYSNEVSMQIQMGIFGRQAEAHEDPMHFANPAYALFAVLPWLFLSFDWAQASWLSFNLLALLVVLFISFPRAPRWVLLLAPFFYQVVFGLVLGNFAVPVFAVMLLAFAVLLRPDAPGKYAQVGLGILLAWTTIKPQSVWLFLLLLLVIALRKRYVPMLVGFFSGLTVLITAALLVRPDWPLSWLERVLGYAAYPNYLPSREFYLGLIFQPNAVRLLSVGLSVLFVLLCFVLILMWQRSRVSFWLVLSWCAWTMYFIHPNSLSYEQLMLLLPPLLWAVSENVPKGEKLLFWLGGWVFSYAALLLGLLLDIPWAASHLPLVAYLLWMVWLLVRKHQWFRSSDEPGWAGF